MAIPTRWDMALPYLKVLRDGRPRSSKEMIQSVADEFKLTDGERGERYGEKGQKKFQHILRWARYELKEAGLIKSGEERGSTMITPEGLDVLMNPPEKIDKEFLSGRPGYSQDSELDNAGDPLIFALEKHLQEFLIKNWYTIMGTEYDIMEGDGESKGEYPTDTGKIDILARSKDGKRYLVVELKKGRPSDAVVGQCLRYMGDVKSELAGEDQDVKGVIIAREGDKKIQSALSVTQNIEFQTYEVDFKLISKHDPLD